MKHIKLFEQFINEAASKQLESDQIADNAIQYLKSYFTVETVKAYKDAEGEVIDWIEAVPEGGLPVNGIEVEPFTDQDKKKLAKDIRKWMRDQTNMQEALKKEGAILKKLQPDFKKYQFDKMPMFNEVMQMIQAGVELEKKKMAINCKLIPLDWSTDQAYRFRQQFGLQIPQTSRYPELDYRDNLKTELYDISGQIYDWRVEFDIKISNAFEPLEQAARELHGGTLLVNGETDIEREVRQLKRTGYKASKFEDGIIVRGLRSPNSDFRGKVAIAWSPTDGIQMDGASLKGEDQSFQRFLEVIQMPTWTEGQWD